MSKRKITHQQSARIKKKQNNYHLEPSPNTTEGLVIKRFSRHVLIEDHNQIRTLCVIRPTLDALVAGDRILWQTEGSNQGVVVSRYPRDSVLGRPDKHGQLKPIAANITQAVIVVAPKPEISWSLLDSYLIMTEYLNLKACIVFNKTDIASSELKNELKQRYEGLGYPIVFTGHEQTNGHKRLKDALNQQISVFVGQSGVGKSSLIAQILPNELSVIQIGAISDKSELGCHTTRNSCLYHIPTGGILIDSPGVREFTLWQLSPLEVANGFREFKPFLEQCKFRNCNHHNTPGCAVLKAVKNQIINPKRHESYVKISAQFAK
jgi:ribosome biogenesis GTPase / thiamine phosphate phosphatase